jgi:hypothetical protein
MTRLLPNIKEPAFRKNLSSLPRIVPRLPEAAPAAKSDTPPSAPRAAGEGY